MRKTSVAALLGVTLALGACGPNWKPLTGEHPATLNSRTVLDFHARGGLVRLHGVKFSKDSVSGIPWLDHLSCDTCRVVYAETEMADVRTGNPGASAWIILGPFMGLIGFGVLVALTWPRGD